MADMNFGVHVLPKVTTTYNLGSTDKKWNNIYGTLKGNADTATKLATARSLKTKLDSTTAVTFDGSADQNAIPVTGTLPIANGGTGATTAAGARTNLGLGSLATKNGLAWNEITQSGANSLPDGTSDFTDNTELLTSYASNNGFADTNALGKVYKRDAICMYNYVKTKASGTWGISISGNAATATTATYATYPKIVAGNEIRLDVSTKPSSAITLCWAWAWSDGSKDAKINRHNFYNGNGALAEIQGSKVYGAVWNDYAEYRITKDVIEPGRCVIETGKDDLILSTERLQPGAEIVSDTFGFAIGETDTAKTPIATTGRVLAYIYEGREAARAAIGKPVCSGPDGTVSIMTDEEYQKYGYYAIGTISAVPDYEEWGTGNVKVNNRIWIRVR